MVLRLLFLLLNIEKGILLKLQQIFRVFLLLQKEFLLRCKLYHNILPKLSHEFLRCAFRGSILFWFEMQEFSLLIFLVLRFEL